MADHERQLKEDEEKQAILDQMHKVRRNKQYLIRCTRLGVVNLDEYCGFLI